MDIYSVENSMTMSEMKSKFIINLLMDLFYLESLENRYLIGRQLVNFEEFQE